MQAPALLEVRGLDTGYDETQVLWNVSLEVMRGEVIALVGANGAGKSTLLAAISGLLPAWKGTISFAGREITYGAVRGRESAPGRIHTASWFSRSDCR